MPPWSWGSNRDYPFRCDILSDGLPLLVVAPRQERAENLDGRMKNQKDDRHVPQEGEVAIDRFMMSDVVSFGEPKQDGRYFRRAGTTGVGQLGQSDSSPLEISQQNRR